MLRPFRLKRPIGPDSTMDLDDVLNTKRALRDLGHFRVPKYGLTPYPDEPMIAGVKSFQRRHGLREDGVMKPDGPTIATLGRSLNQRRRQRPGLGIVEGEWDWMRERFRQRNPFPDPVFTTIPRRRAGPPSVFDVLGDVGRDRRNRPRDVLALRRALAWAGHLPRHKAVDATDADEELVGAVERFQKAAKLKSDGLVGPGGETARALDGAIAMKVKAHLQETAGKDAAGDTPDKDGSQIAMAPKPRPGGGSSATEGATTFPPFLGGGAAAIGAGIAARELLRQQQEKKGKGEVPIPPQPGIARPRTDIAPKVPPPPGLEPPDDKDRPPTKTESPAQPVELPDLSQPLPKVDKPTVFIHPSPKPGEFDNLILESKGNPRTKKHMDGVRDEFLDANPGWKHIAGGRDRETGAEKTEYNIPGPGRAFPRPGKKEGEGDGRAGSIRTDMTFVGPDGKTFVHIQTVDLDRNGNPKVREQDSSLRGFRSLEARREKGEIHHIILIGKDWMMPK